MLRGRASLVSQVMAVGLIAMTAAFVLWPRIARADLHLDGRWKQSALREDFTVQNWLEAGCGPPPQSTSTGGGEIITLRMEGDELAFVGGGRVFRTNQCYDPMPTLSRESHSRASDGKTWRTRCTTSAADPRKTILNTLVVATTEAHIDLVETGRYEITLENGRCMADVKRTRSFDLVLDTKDETPPRPTATAPSAPPRESPRPDGTCATPGEPSKLEVRPSKKLVRPGESFAFRGLVLDARGCETRTATAFRAESVRSGVTVEPGGLVKVDKTATEGTLEIVASAAGKDVRVFVEIVSAAGYEDLLARSGLNAAGENDEASTAVIASQSLGTGASRVEDRAHERRLVFLAIVGGVLVLLGVVAVVLVRRLRRAKHLLAEAEERHEVRVKEVLDRRRQREEEHAAQMRAHEESVLAAKASSRARTAVMPATETVRCPSCKRGLPAGTAFCPHDGSSLVTPAGVSTVKSAGGVCPVCNKGFGPEVSRCPVDKEELLPFPAPAAITAGAARSPALRGKICPTCGDRFDGSADYCGKDGTHLVLIN